MLKIKTFETIAGKGENAAAFSPFSTVFSTSTKAFSLF